MENSFTKIQLPDFVLANLYTNQLVTLDTEQPKQKTVVVKQNIKPQPIYLGDNKKNILIAVQDETAVYLKDEWLQLLTNMLLACKLNMGDVAIVNLAKHPFTFIELKEKLAPEFCLLFGVSTQAIDLPFMIPNYQIQKYNQCSFVAATAFDLLEGSSQAAKLEKSKLWVCLKQLFNV